MDWSALRELLGSAGDVSTVALLYVAWRFDRRIFALELAGALKREKGVA